MEKSEFRFPILGKNLGADSACFERKFVLGEALFVAHLDELFLKHVVNRRAFSVALNAGEMFFFAAGIDAVSAGGFL